MADEEDSIFGVRQDNPAYAILAELGILMRGLASDRLRLARRLKS
jgi:hypothetical protein